MPLAATLHVLLGFFYTYLFFRCIYIRNHDRIKKIKIKNDRIFAKRPGFDCLSKGGCFYFLILILVLLSLNAVWCNCCRKRGNPQFYFFKKRCSFFAVRSSALSGASVTPRRPRGAVQMLGPYLSVQHLSVCV